MVWLKLREKAVGGGEPGEVGGTQARFGNGGRQLMAMEIRHGNSLKAGLVLYSFCIPTGYLQQSLHIEKKKKVQIFGKFSGLF